MGPHDHHQPFHGTSTNGDCTIQWTAISDADPVLGLEAALPYLLDRAPSTFAEPAPAVVSNPRHAA